MEGDSSSDRILVEKAATGDHTAFGMLLARYREQLHRLIYFMVHHEEDTWDLLQDTCLNAYQALPKLKNPDIFSSWITRIAVNLAINHLKRKSRWRKCQEKLVQQSEVRESDAPDQYVESNETQEKVRALIALLPPKQKTVLVLADIEGRSYQEIATILNCRIGTVMSRLFYARSFLRKRLQSLDGRSDTLHQQAEGNSTASLITKQG